MFENFRNVEHIEINRLALHIVNNRDGVLTLSEGEIDLESLDEKLSTYIRSHILKSLREDRSRLARFIHPNTYVQKWTYEIFDNPEEKFLPNSQLIADKLYKTMEEDKRILPGDLLVILYTDIDRGTKNMALLKMDYNDTVSRKVVVDPETKLKKIQLILVGENFPNLRQKLQKVAFLIEKDQIKSSADPALLILDRQQGEEGKIADFFRNDFLACEVLLTDDKKTIELFKSTHSWIGTQPETNLTKTLIKTTMEDIKMEKNINIYDLAQAVFGNDEDLKNDDEMLELKKSYINHILKSIGDPDLKATASPALQKVINGGKIKTTDNIEISGPIDLLSEKVEYIDQRVNEHGVEICDILIKSVTVSN
ncbi:nucleoid-associated protein [Cytobacillus pseudoceanisediminis]|uniref:nucleoid-associated protein n=1 Tax=Cytobacillus pseudoceanisediminis TaxID=3051614 RepID=UPI00366A2DD9